MEPWTLIDSQNGPGKFVAVRTDWYRLTDGSVCEWDIIVAGDSVAVLALTHDQQVILARQFRPGPGVVLDELPGGAVEDDEAPVLAAGRELLEETGYRGTVEVIGHTWVAGNMTRRRWVAVATGCSLVCDQQLDEAEQIEVVLRELVDFRRQVRDGAMTDPAVGYRALDHLGLL